MRQLRITRVQVGIAGLVLAVALAALFGILFIRPLQANTQQIKVNTEAEETEAAKRSSVEGELAEAKLEEARIAAEYDGIMETRMPEVSLADPVAAMMRLWDLPREEGLLIDKWFAGSGGRVSGYGFPAFPTTLPNQSQRVLDPLNWNLRVEVNDFQALLRWLQKVPEAPRLMLIRGLTIQGSRQPGQPLTVDVPVTMYLWTQDYVGTAVAAAPQVGAGAGRGGARAGAGAGGGGFGPGAGLRGGGGMAGARAGGGGFGPGAGLRGGG